MPVRLVTRLVCVFVLAAVGLVGQAASAAEAGTVSVTVRHLHGATGGSLAGVLQRGSGTSFAAHPAVGGFAVAVPRADFSTTQVVRRPDPGWLKAAQAGHLFPYVLAKPLVLPPGTYTLVLWAAPLKLSPFSRWVPADTNGLRSCTTQVTVPKARSTVRITVNGLPPMRGASLPCT